MEFHLHNTYLTSFLMEQKASVPKSVKSRSNQSRIYYMLDFVPEHYKTKDICNCMWRPSPYYSLLPILSFQLLTSGLQASWNRDFAFLALFWIQVLTLVLLNDIRMKWSNRHAALLPSWMKYLRTPESWGSSLTFTR